MDKNISAEEPIMVSIRCITYNHEPYIRQCLEGFVMQKTNFRFEAIVHDDASTDHTADIIREYAEKYPNIIKPIYETENQYSKHDGALRRALDNACKGKYFALCEGDDYWTDPYKLQKQVDFLEQNEHFVMCFHNSTIVDENNNIISNTYLNCLNMKDLSEFDLKSGNHPPTQTIMYRSDLYRKEIPILNKTNKLINGDTILCSLLGKYGKAKYLSNIENSIYRKHHGGIWSLMPQIYRDECAYQTYSFLQLQHPDLADMYCRSRISLLYKIMISSLKNNKVSLAYKYYFVFVKLVFEKKDFIKLWTFHKEVCYNFIHK